jgi:FkbM family methyltransferase
MIDSCYRLFKGIRNYRNLVPLMYQRATHSALIDVTDRRTGLRFKCRRGADTMLAETFHALIYHVPFAPIRSGDIVIDVGANHGFFSCWAAQQGAIVHAFEPDPNTFDRLVENIRLNGFEGIIRPHQYAIADETGESHLFCSSDLGGGLSTIIPAFAVKSGMEVMSQAKIKAMSLTDALEYCQVDRVRICKLDCEGAEYSILGSLKTDILNRFDSFVMEYHPQAYNLPQFMDLLLSFEGYHISKVVSQDRDLENANLSVVRSELIREWSRSTTVERRHANGQMNGVQQNGVSQNGVSQNGVSQNGIHKEHPPKQR